MTYVKKWAERGQLIQRPPDGKYEMLTIHSFHRAPPPPYHAQNIEKKEEGKILPRKILYPKELDGRIFHPKDLPAQRDQC
ncbi:MAG: hypothetical protein ACLPND_25875 [Candidatus Korobacteraceae bacterium]